MVVEKIAKQAQACYNQGAIQTPYINAACTGWHPTQAANEQRKVCPMSATPHINADGIISQCDTAARLSAALYFGFHGILPDHEDAENFIAELLEFYGTYTPEQIAAHNQARRWQMALSRALPYSNRQKLSGYVYLAHDGQIYKIGMSKDPVKRLTALKSPNGKPVKLVLTVPADDMRQLEAALHYYFDDRYVGGEWFELTPADVEFIKGLAE